jgi:hypothetical protein
MFNDKFALYAVNKRIQQPKETFLYTVGHDYWSMTAQ